MTGEAQAAAADVREAVFDREERSKELLFQDYIDVKNLPDKSLVTSPADAHLACHCWCAAFSAERHDDVSVPFFPVHAACVTTKHTHTCICMRARVCVCVTHMCVCVCGCMFVCIRPNVATCAVVQRPRGVWSSKMLSNAQPFQCQEAGNAK